MTMNKPSWVSLLPPHVDSWQLPRLQWKLTCPLPLPSCSQSIHQTISDRAKQLLERAQYVLPPPATSGGVEGNERERKPYNKQGRGGDRSQHQGIGQGQTPRPVEIKS